MSTSELKLTFDAVYYHVRDIEKSVAFYRDILGFHLTSRDYVARFDLGGAHRFPYGVKHRSHKGRQDTRKKGDTHDGGLP